MSAIVNLWSDRDFRTAEILALVERNGVDFQMSEANLSSLLEAGRAGGRPTSEVAQLVYRLFRECWTCRADFWRKLRKEDLFLLLEKKSSAFAAQELASRKGDNLPQSADFLRELAQKGAKDDLLLEVNKGIEIETPADFKLVNPKIREPADIKLHPLAGKLILWVEVSGEVEFIFRHNRLFYHVIHGLEPKDLGSTYFNFGPQGDDKQIDWKIEDTPKVDRKDVNVAFVTDTSGFNGFKITVRTKKKKPFEVHITWWPKSGGTT